MSEIRINIIDRNQTISGEMHGSFGDVLIASLTAEPETVEELEIATERFIKRESAWSFFRSFRKYENFSLHDAGLLVIDLAAKVIVADSTYSYFSTTGKIRIKTEHGEYFRLSYQLSDDWKTVGSIPEYSYWESKRREERLNNPLFDAREILFGKPLFSFVIAEYLANKDSIDEDLFTEIRAKWLMTERSDLNGKTPREVLLEKMDFIESDLSSRSLQWSVTGFCPPPLPENSNAYKFAGFGRHEIVVYYDLFRHLLGECFENEITQPEVLEQIANDWLKDENDEYAPRTGEFIIESERRRLNLTVSAQECLIDDDCPLCVMMSEEFDTPTFCHYDGSHFEFDRFEFSFETDREKWEAEQREYDEMSRKFDEKYKRQPEADNNFFEENEELF